MMPSSELELFGTLIADNAVSAFECNRNGAPFHPIMRAKVVSVLVRSLLLVMPTTSSDALAAGCNRGLDDVVGAIDLGGPRVEADHGSITITPA
jgi:hypothetical protein